MSVVYDAGVLVAAERNDRAAWADIIVPGSSWASCRRPPLLSWGR